MQDILNQFIIDKQGHFIEVSNSGDKNNPDILYQCMDLAYDFLTALRIPKSTIQHQYAYQVYKNPNPDTLKYFDIIPNSPTFIPQDGDLTVFDKTNSNPAGHIGIALGGGTVQSFKNFEQNYPIRTSAAIRTRDYMIPKLLGVLRPKVQGTQNDVPSVTDQTKIPQLGNKEVQQIKSEILAKDEMIKDLQATNISRFNTLEQIRKLVQ